MYLVVVVAVVVVVVVVVVDVDRCVCVCVCVCACVCVRMCVEKGADVVQSGSVRCPTAQMPKGGLNPTL